MKDWPVRVPFRPNGLRITERKKKRKNKVSKTGGWSILRLCWFVYNCLDPFFPSLYYFPSPACSLISHLKTFLTEHRAFISILKLSFHSFLSCFIPSTMFISTLSYQSFYFPLFPSLLHLILFFLLSFFYPILITSPSFYFFISWHL